MYNLLPSKCLYFGKPLRGNLDILAESKNTITLRDRIICFRVPSRQELEVARGSGLKIVTVVDDDYSGIVNDWRLPIGYRLRLLGRLMCNWQRLKDLTNKWVITSPALQEIYSDSVQIDPYWGISDACDHARGEESLHLAFLATRSHLHDLKEVVSIMCRFLEDFNSVKLTLFLGKHCPKKLSELPNVNNHSPMSWPSYLNFLPRLNIDLAVLPCRETQVNSCRSRSKLFEAIYAGGLCLFDERYAHKDYAKKHHLGLSFNCTNLRQTLESWASDLDALADMKNKAKENALMLQQEIVARQRKVLLS